MASDRIETQPRRRAALVNARSRDSRSALIRAALSLWGEGDFDQAFESTTAADIARAAGVSKGTFYFHFANKEAILLAASSVTIQKMIDQIDAGVRRTVPLSLLTDEVMTSMARRVTRGPRVAAIKAGGLGTVGRPDGGPVATPRLDVAFEALVRYGQERGDIDRDVEVAEAAAMLTAVTMEAVARWGAGDRPASWLGPTLCSRVAVILRGVATRGSPPPDRAPPTQDPHLR
jgi:AcrR family transcriptional regulator